MPSWSFPRPTLQDPHIALLQVANRTQKKCQASRSSYYNKVLTSLREINLGNLLTNAKVTAETSASCIFSKRCDLESIIEGGSIAAHLDRNTAGIQ